MILMFRNSKYEIEDKCRNGWDGPKSFTPPNPSVYYKSTITKRGTSKKGVISNVWVWIGFRSRHILLDFFTLLRGEGWTCQWEKHYDLMGFWKVILLDCLMDLLYVYDVKLLDEKMRVNWCWIENHNHNPLCRMPFDGATIKLPNNLSR